tara:strand:- start:244 stop:663 length:420 start_codon:yes stop_codon:yes gene_type:complete
MFQTGRTGEYLAAFLLSDHYNIESSIVTTIGDDLWCKLPDGRLVKIQVKTSNTRQKHRGTYQFQTSNQKSSDFYCFVSLKDKTFLLKPLSWLKQRQGIRFSINDFSLEKMHQSVEECLNIKPRIVPEKTKFEEHRKNCS